MRNRRAVVLAGAIVLSMMARAEAAGLHVLASNGVKSAVEQLKPLFETASGHTLTIEFSTAAALRARIENGAAFDVAILTDDALDALVMTGKLAGSTRTELAAVGMGVGIRRNAPRVEVGSPASLKQTFLAVQSIAYAGDGASRPYIDKMFAALGIAAEAKSRTRLTPPGQAPHLVAAGGADLVVTLISEIVPVEGVVLAGPIPKEFQAYLGFSAAANAAALEGDAAKAFIGFLDGAVASKAFQAIGMEQR